MYGGARKWHQEGGAGLDKGRKIICRNSLHQSEKLLLLSGWQGLAHQRNRIDRTRTEKANQMAKKTERMTCTYTAASVVYNFEREVEGKWVGVDSRKYEMADLTQKVYEGPKEEKVTLAAYGLRALLADRTSQLRELGPAAVLEGMDALYEVLVEGQWNVARKAGGGKRLDMVLVELIAELKQISLGAAEELVKKTPAETIAAIIAKYQTRYNELKVKAVEGASGVDLGDLL